MGRSLLPDVMPFIKATAFALLGTICSQFNVIESFSPFSAALVAAVPMQHCFAVFAGASAGYLFTGGLLHALGYACSLALIMGVRIILAAKCPKLNDTVTSCALACFFCACGGALRLVTGGTQLITALLAVCETVAAGGFCFIFKRCFASPVLQIGIKRLRRTDMAFTAVSCCTFLMCASGICICGFRPAHVAAVFAVLLAAHYRGYAGGSGVGITLGAFLCISEETRHVFACYALGGLAAGIFSSYGQFGVSVAFAAASCIVTLFNQGSKPSLITLFESALTCIAFIALPPSLLVRAENYFDNSGFVNEQTVNREAAFRLRRAANTVADVSEMVTQVTERMDCEFNPQHSKIYARIQQTVCRDCTQKSKCWGEDFDKTAADVMRLLDKSNHRDGNEKNALECNCVRFKELDSAVIRDSAAYINTFSTSLQINELRHVVADQFNSISRLLDEISERISGEKLYDSAKSALLKRTLRESIPEVENAAFYLDVNGKATVEVTLLDDATAIRFSTMRRIIDETVLRRFDSPEVCVLDLHTLVSYPERPSFRVKYGCCQFSSRADHVCGDSAEVFTDTSGNTVALLSDGMGTGARAAIEGTMAGTLMKKLITAGFSFENALSLVNSALLIKSADESLATLDGLSINTYTGCASFYKAGAAASFIRSEGTVSCIEKSSLPAGILRGIEFAAEERMLNYSDIVLLVSDGVTVGDCGWISDELLAWSTDSMTDLATHIASLARLKSDDESRDDITVIALKAVKNNALSYESSVQDVPYAQNTR